MNLLLRQVALFACSFTAPAQTTHPRTSHKKVVHQATTKVKAKHVATSPTVYNCSIGTTVKYRVSPGCLALARCRAAVVPIPLASAQQQRDPCK
jgi:hypothetical protein